jgi:hypothetical protein
VASNSEEAIREFFKVKSRIKGVEWLGEVTTRASEAHKRARRRARERGIEFSLTARDVQALYESTKGRCELTSITFENSGPFCASIDRINSGRGYLVGNVRLVCWAVNNALNKWGDGVFSRIATAYVARKLTEEGGDDKNVLLSSPVV